MTRGRLWLLLALSLCVTCAACYAWYIHTNDPAVQSRGIVHTVIPLSGSTSFALARDPSGNDYFQDSTILETRAIKDGAVKESGLISVVPIRATWERGLGQVDILGYNPHSTGLLSRTQYLLDATVEPQVSEQHIACLPFGANRIWLLGEDRIAVMERSTDGLRWKYVRRISIYLHEQDPDRFTSAVEILLPDRLKSLADLAEYEGNLYVCGESAATSEGSPPSELVVFDLAGGREVSSVGVDLSLEGIGSCLTIHDASRVAIIGKDKVVIINAKLGQAVSTLEIADEVNLVTACFMPEKEFIAFGGSQVTVWDVQNGNRIAALGVDNRARMRKYADNISQAEGERWNFETFSNYNLMQFYFVHFYSKESRLIAITRDGLGVIWEFVDSTSSFNEVRRFDVMGSDSLY